MGPFPPSDEKEYILVVVDYASKWVVITCYLSMKLHDY